MAHNSVKQIRAERGIAEINNDSQTKNKHFTEVEVLTPEITGWTMPNTVLMEVTWLSCVSCLIRAAWLLQHRK